MNKNILKALIKVLFCLLILAIPAAYGMENNKQTLNKKSMIDKVLVFIAASGVMLYCNQFWANLTRSKGAPASQELQILGQEAQMAVGIPADRHVPIQYVPGLKFAAVAECNAIIIGNEFADNEIAYGVKRCNMFHEAVHIKYHDDVFGKVLHFCSSLVIPFVTMMFVKSQKKLKLLYLPSLLAGCYLGDTILAQFSKHRERRADIEGHYATQCYKCVVEKIEDMRRSYEWANDAITQLNDTTDFKEAQILAYAKRWINDKKRYLSIEENETIAAELKYNNKLCSFHARLH